MAPQLMLGSAGSLLEFKKKHYKYEIILTFNLLVLKIDKSYRAIPTIYLCFSHLKLDVLSTVILYPNRYKFTYIAQPSTLIGLHEVLIFILRRQNMHIQYVDLHEHSITPTSECQKVWMLSPKVQNYLHGNDILEQNSRMCSCEKLEVFGLKGKCLW